MEIFGPIRKKIILKWLNNVAAHSQYRIDAGDLDFDDVLYRSRDAAMTLLDIFDKEGN